MCRERQRREREGQLRDVAWIGVRRVYRMYCMRPDLLRACDR